MKVSLFVTCLVDQLRPSVGVATVRVLRRAGCDVSFDARQTCCGQPAYNAGYRTEARGVARTLLDLYADADAVVVPSGSCASMFQHLPSLWDEGTELHERARALAGRVHELSAFLVRVLDVGPLGARFDGRVTWHDACHGRRDLGLRDEPRRLIGEVAGCELVELDAAESCCGFGGTFSVKYPELSVAMLDTKLEGLAELGVEALVSAEVSCLMQLGGRLARTGSSIRTLHLAELLDTHRGES